MSALRVTRSKLKRQARCKLNIKILCIFGAVLSISILQIVTSVAAIIEHSFLLNSTNSAKIGPADLRSTAGGHIYAPSFALTLAEVRTLNPQPIYSGTRVHSHDEREALSRDRRNSTLEDPARRDISSQARNSTDGLDCARQNKTTRVSLQRAPIIKGDLLVLPSSISRQNDNSNVRAVELMNVLKSGNYLPTLRALNSLNLQSNAGEPSLAELTAAGTAAGLLISDLAARSSQPIVREAEPEANSEAANLQTDQDIALDAQDNARPSRPKLAREPTDAAQLDHASGNIEAMPDSMESLMNSELNEADEDAEPSQSANESQTQDRIYTGKGTKDADELGSEEADDEPQQDDKHITQGSQNHQDLSALNPSSYIPQDTAIYQPETRLISGFDPATGRPIFVEQGNHLLVPMQNSQSDLSSAAGHHYGYKKKKIKKKKKVKKKVVIKKKKKKVKKYQVKIVSYKKKKKKKKVKKVKKHKKPKKHKKLHHHDHGKYYM